MLASIVPILLCPICRSADAPLHLTVARVAGDGHVADGELTCTTCAARYAIRDERLDLTGTSPLDAPQLAQRRHFDWFASEAPTTYDRYQESPFWRAADDATFARWIGRVQKGSLLLDVGCANGRSAWPFSRTGATIVGCDISAQLIAQAIGFSRDRGVHPTTTFIVADANRLPFRDETFDAVLTYGALHHLPDPARTCRDIQRVMRVGGVHFASENNQSAFRAVFDALMKLVPLWIEEAGQEPLISDRMVREWLRALPAAVRTRTHVFVPPHLVNALGGRLGAALLRATDAAGSIVPIVRRNGGLLVFEATKLAASASDA